MLIIGIDAHYLGNNQSGNERYTRNLIQSLVTLYPGDFFRVYVTNPDVMVEPLFDNKNVEAILLKPSSPLYRIPVGFPLELRKNPVDVLHVQYNAPLICPAKLIVTMHDISWAKHPEWFPFIKGRQIALRAKPAVKGAAAIICGTDFVKNEIVEWYSIDPEKVSVTPYGVNKTKEVSEAEITNFRRKYDLQKPYVLTVGDLQPRKNLVRLIEAFKAFLDSTSSDHELVLAGKQAWHFKDIFKKVEDLELGKKVRFMGYLPEDDIPALYASSSIFVYPSLYEGFGFPPLEAMSHEVPVAASNTGTVAEVVGSAGISFNPLDSQSIASALTAINEDADLRKDLVSAGKKRVKDFVWENTAQKTMSLYLQVAKDKSVENRIKKAVDVKPS